jgi:hypothetical protein
VPVVGLDDIDAIAEVASARAVPVAQVTGA